jgi:hypothetical protein
MVGFAYQRVAAGDPMPALYQSLRKRTTPLKDSNYNDDQNDNKKQMDQSPEGGKRRHKRAQQP